MPASSRARARETHGVAVENTRWIETIAYSDGGGNVVMQKATAAPNGAPRWVGTGRVVLNDKGLPIKQYEPFFSATDAFEAEEGFSGVTPLITYDPLGRAVRVDLPDGNARTVAFGPWEQTTWDENDQPGKPHEGTPTTVLLDAQGRPYQTVERLGTTELITTVTLDVAGNATLVTDPRGVDVQAQTFDLLGRPITTMSPDSGVDNALLDVDGQPRMVWRSGDLGVEATYDALRRRLTTWEWDTDAETRVQRESFVYGEGETDPEDGHLRGRVVRIFDTAGSLAFTYDFKGNVLSTTRRFFEDDEAAVDWSTADPEVVLEADTFAVVDAFDAMNRRVSRTAPDGAVTAYTYDDGGRLIGVAVDSDDFVEEILYSARGQRTSITYGNGVGTTYTYDAATFRLTRLHTLRGSEALQDLGYTYDPVGNILAITNDAEVTLYFDNAAVTPDQEFEYDALYRLTNAWGREKTARGWADWVEPAYGPVPSAEVMQGYEQRYEYDVGGNIKKMRHLLGGTTEWVRDYAYPTTSNRLTSTTESGGTATYAHDVRGSIVFWPHLYQDGVSSPNVVPDFRDQMRRALLNANDYAVYAYDHAGQRARKVVKKGQNVEERRYVAGWEVWRKTVSGTLDEERTTLHVMDGERRIAMMETKTVSGGSAVGSPVPRVRYQLDNHLGTSILELTDNGGIISYEEYHPYGTCAWWAGDASVDVSRRRYRYTGMERDEETGLSCHGVRYYAAWLGRWGSADPSRLVGGLNHFAYASSNPVLLTDTGGRKPRTREPSPPAVPDSAQTPQQNSQEPDSLRAGEIRQVFAFDPATEYSEDIVVPSDHPGVEYFVHIVERGDTEYRLVGVDRASARSTLGDELGSVLEVSDGLTVMNMNVATELATSQGRLDLTIELSRSVTTYIVAGAPLEGPVIPAYGEGGTLIGHEGLHAGTQLTTFSALGVAGLLTEGWSITPYEADQSIAVGGGIAIPLHSNVAPWAVTRDQLRAFIFAAVEYADIAAHHGPAAPDYRHGEPPAPVPRPDWEDR